MYGRSGSQRPGPELGAADGAELLDRDEADPRVRGAGAGLGTTEGEVAIDGVEEGEDVNNAGPR